MAFHCVDWTDDNEHLALDFLKARYATSMFLLSNYSEKGPRLTDHPNSGNFKLIQEGENVRAAFVLTRRGNLLVSGDPSQEIHSLILEACQRESLSLKGVIGKWDLAAGIWDLLQDRKILDTCSFQSKEILYQLDHIPEAEPVPGVRFLGEADYAQWRPIRHAYNEEEGLAHELSEEQLKGNFSRYSAAREFWGLFDNGRMIATTALNAVALDIGQVGGVYTVPDQRGKGFSQLTMRQMLSDCAKIHGLKRMILFTGEKNFPAQKVYEKLGFKRIGHFGIFFV